MKFILLFASLMVLACLGPIPTLGQSESTLRIAEIIRYDTAVPGQIVELRVEGLGVAPEVKFLPQDFQIAITQDGVKQQIKVREVRLSRMVETNPDGTFAMKPFQSVSFVVPKGLNPGEVALALSFRKKHSNTVKLTIVDRPLRPSVATLVNVSDGLPAAPASGDLGLSLERQSKVEIVMTPLTDPDDANSSVLIRFKQGDAVFEETTRVVHKPERTRPMDGGVAFLPEQDVIEVDIPAALTIGPAEMQILVRTDGQTGEPATLKVQITDAVAMAESPEETAPRLLYARPQRIGPGQTLMLRIDHLRTLGPDPSQTMIIFEQGKSRYAVRPDYTSAEHTRNGNPNDSVMLMVHPTRQLMGAVQLRVLNSSRGEQRGLSEGQAIEIADEVVPPVVSSVREANAEELRPLREMYEMRHREGRPFPDYDPKYSYVTIRVTGLDFNRRLVRIAFEQNGRRASLTPADFSLQAPDFVVVRVPAGIAAGPVTISIENRGEDSFSTPVIMSFVLATPN